MESYITYRALWEVNMQRRNYNSKLVEARNRRGWSQDQAAKHLLISKSFYQKLELGERAPGVHLAIFINKIYQEDIFDVDFFGLSA